MRRAALLGGVLGLRLRNALPAAALFALSIAFRSPRLLNASALNSDAAIVGLQARHILQGEWSPLLHGSSYQSSVDSTVAALWFRALGASPLALILSTLANHVVLTLLVFSTLKRRLDPWLAFACSLPLVLTPSPLHTFVLSAPRQASLTLVFLSLWVLDKAPSARWSRLRLALGGAIAGAAVFADPYALLMAPIALLAGALACFDDKPQWKAAAQRMSCLAAGFALGIVPYALLLASPSHSTFYGDFDLRLVPDHARLLWRECLPWLLSAKVFLAYPGHPRDPWSVAWPFRIVQIAGALSFVAAIVGGGVLAFRRRVPWPIARMAWAGAAALPLTIAAFLGSKVVFDLFASRYLVAIILLAPFPLAVIAVHLGRRWFPIALTPYLVSAAVGGWVAFGDETCGPWPCRSPDGTARQELQLAHELAARGVDAGIADYWTAYRFVFLTSERIALVPWHRHQDRYPPYRQKLLQAGKFAYVFDDTRSWEDFATSQRELEARARAIDRIDVGILHAVIYEGHVPDGF